jgi:hypothetical protein
MQVPPPKLEAWMGEEERNGGRIQVLVMSAVIKILFSRKFI